MGFEMNVTRVAALPAAAVPSPGDRSAQDIARLEETTRELEGLFLGVLMKAMRSSVGAGGLFRNGMSLEAYQEMFDQEVARNLARAGGIGLAHMVLRDQLCRQAASERNQGVNTAQVLSPVDR